MNKLVVGCITLLIILITLFIFARPIGFISETKIPIDKKYSIKDGFCYSDFLENCVGKRVEVTGKIVKRPCPNSEMEAYVLCDTNIPPCDCQTYVEPYALISDYPHCLALVQPCYTENTAIDINSKIEQFLSNPLDKTVKVTGEVFVVIVEKTEPSIELNIVGISPESITVVENEK